MSKATLRRTLALTGTAAALTTLVSAPASAAPAPAAPSRAAAEAPAEVAAQGSRVTRLRFVLNGKSRCVDVPKASKKRGVRLQLWNCTGKSNQKWVIYNPRVTPSAKAQPGYLIYNVNSGLCINVERASKKAGARLIQWTCDWSTRNGVWGAARNGRGHSFWNDLSRQCMTVGGNSTKNGAWLIQWPCRTNLASQIMYLDR